MRKNGATKGVGTGRKQTRRARDELQQSRVATRWVRETRRGKTKVQS